MRKEINEKKNEAVETKRQGPDEEEVGDMRGNKNGQLFRSGQGREGESTYRLALNLVGTQTNLCFATTKFCTAIFDFQRKF